MDNQKRSFLDRILCFKKEEPEESINQSALDDYEDKSNTENGISEVSEEVEIVENVSNANREDEIAEESDAKIEWIENKDCDSKKEGQLTIDVYQTKGFIIIKSIIGGVDPENVDVSITGDMITIKGTRENPDRVHYDDYYYRECFWGRFSRSIILPCDVNQEGIEARMKNGILTIKLPKVKKDSSIRVKVVKE